mmetsp:Transcript_2400/g.8561  ORF Transcript_2400/g.8561 Transcript_2400/m.8561 type:complete len:422 (+) Transcript_2400:8-1273(+)
MLSPQELARVLALLKPGGRALGTQAEEYRAMVERPEVFRTNCGLYLLLIHGLLEEEARLSALYILFDQYREHDLKANPFLPLFVSVLQGGLGWKPSASVLVRLLVTSPGNLGKVTSSELVAKQNSVPAVQANVAELVEACKSRPPPQLTSFEALGMLPPTLSDPELCWGLFEEKPEAAAQAKDEAEKRAEALSAMVSGESFRLSFARPPPPLLTVDSEELVWLNPVEERAVLWDTSVDASIPGSSGMRKLTERALAETVPEEVAEHFKQRLEADPRIVHHIGLSPEDLPLLVEHNPSLAIAALLCLMPSSRIGEYFTALVNMQMTLHSMEVVNRLTSSVELPKEFVHLYICNCIASCQSIKDKYMQNRMVRLVCVFLQSLIRNNIIDVKEIFMVVQAFCVEHSKIREAAGLFRLLKSLEQQ